jgi:hypothetical protein
LLRQAGREGRGLGEGMLSPWLISPDLDAYFVPDKPALEQLITELDIDRDNDAGNLRQLSSSRRACCLPESAFLPRLC